jgi:hypothetical protein
MVVKVELAVVTKGKLLQTEQIAKGPSRDLLCSKHS